MEYLLIFVLWLALSALIGKWAASKGRSAGFWFFAALAISPLLAAVFVALASRIGDAALQRCPDCREQVRQDARKCRHCGAALVPTTAPAAA